MSEEDESCRSGIRHPDFDFGGPCGCEPLFGRRLTRSRYSFGQKTSPCRSFPGFERALLRSGDQFWPSGSLEGTVSFWRFFPLRSCDLFYSYQYCPSFEVIFSLHPFFLRTSRGVGLFRIWDISYSIGLSIFPVLSRDLPFFFGSKFVCLPFFFWVLVFLFFNNLHYNTPSMV